VPIRFIDAQSLEIHLYKGVAISTGVFDIHADGSIAGIPKSPTEGGSNATCSASYKSGLHSTFISFSLRQL